MGTSGSHAIVVAQRGEGAVMRAWLLVVGCWLAAGCDSGAGTTLPCGAADPVTGDVRACGDEQFCVCGGVRGAGTCAVVQGYCPAGYQFATPERNAEQNAGAHQLRGLMASAVERLSGRERALIQAHYYDDESLQGIGRQFGVSRSWACRLHARAIDHLRDSMAAPSLAA